MKWVTYGCFCLHASDMAESPRLRNESAMSGERGDSVRARDEEAGLTDAIRPRRVMRYLIKGVRAVGTLSA